MEEIKKENSLTNEVEGMMETMDRIVKRGINMIPLSTMIDMDDEEATLIKDYLVLLNQSKTILVLTAKKLDKIEEQNNKILEILESKKKTSK